MKKNILFSAFLLLILRGLSAQVVGNIVPVNLPQKYGWDMIVQDEFEADSLDKGRWWVQDAERPGEICLFTSRPENVYQKDGKMHIVVQKEALKNYQFTGGLVFSSRTFSPNSYIEASLKVPKGKNLWPAFWFWSGENKTYQEIDVAEFYCQRPKETNISNHYWDLKQKRNYKTSIARPKDANGNRIDLSKNYHIYAVEWLTDRIRVFIDNVLFFETKKDIPQGVLSIIFGMGLSDKPDKTTIFPSEFLVDYVRGYKIKPSLSTNR